MCKPGETDLRFVRQLAGEEPRKAATDDGHSSLSGLHDKNEPAGPAAAAAAAAPAESRRHRPPAETAEEMDTKILSMLTCGDDATKRQNLLPSIFPPGQVRIAPESITFEAGRESNECIDGIKVMMSAFAGGWPATSPYACWNCTETFKDRPVGVPEYVDDAGWHCYGNFCSFNCAARHVLDNVHDSNKWEQMSLLSSLSSLIGQTSKIKPAPSRLILKKFGGEVSLADYRRSFVTNAEYRTYHPPLVPILSQMEEINGEGGGKDFDRQFVPMELQRVAQADKNQKQQRMKNLQKSDTIDKCMSISLPGKLAGRAMPVDSF
ncbi:MAG: hypothetical protein ACYCOU_18305 [Sulfobacillus sp.]